MTFCIGFFEESRSEARSGMSPRNQNSSEMVKYVETAKTSHTSGLLNCGQMPCTLGYGISQYAANQGRPVWISGNSSAQMTANNNNTTAKRGGGGRRGGGGGGGGAGGGGPAGPRPGRRTRGM